MTSSRTCVERSIAFQPSETHPPQAHNLAVGHAQTRHLRWSRRAPIVRIENWCSVEHAFVERDVGGRAVVFDTGWSGLFGTPEDARGRRSSPSAPHLMSPHLTEQRVTLVGIDSLNIDDVESGGELTAHPLLLAAGIHAVENLTLLHELPASPSSLRRWRTSVPFPGDPSREPPESHRRRFFRARRSASHSSVSLLHNSCNPGAFERAALRMRGSPSCPPRIEGVVQGDQVEAVLCTFGAARNAGPAVTGVA
jgi:hypothetical protein